MTVRHALADHQHQPLDVTFAIDDRKVLCAAAIPSSFMQTNRGRPTKPTQFKMLCGAIGPLVPLDGSTAEITCVPCLQVFFKDHRNEDLHPDLRAKLGRTP